MTTKDHARAARATMFGAAILGLSLAGLTAGPAAAKPLRGEIVNGSFEVPDVPPGTFQLVTEVPGWTSLGPWIEIQDHVAGDPAPGAGEQFAELDLVGFYQDIQTVPGKTYELTFLYSPRPNTAATENTFRVTAGSESVVIGPLTSGSTTDWQTYTLTFVATSSVTRIQFEDLGTPSPGVGTYIDEVSVTRSVAQTCRPGYGYGDKNHCHTGPPGKA